MEKDRLDSKEENGLEEKQANAPESAAADQPEEEKNNIEISALTKELEEAREEARKNHDLHLRALADTENIRKRAQRERDEYIKYATLPLIKKLLPVLDDFMRAMEACRNSQDYEALRKGVEIIVGHIDQILKAEGVEVIECLGQPFDPQLHQPLMIENSEEYEANIVIEELQKGYKMLGRVIRPSLVKVSG
ncbi:MAG TPA: nucleotide exchange factor GrpE [Syntrophomonadaceae bacterium]|nr:nucleotide exchange factor GrpE [Syntrophomonadaceae bacterium]